MIIHSCIHVPHSCTLYRETPSPTPHPPPTHIHTLSPHLVQAHLAPFLPTHPIIPTGAYPDFKGDAQSFGTMAAAPYGSSLILPISFAYIAMMGSEGLTEVGGEWVCSWGSGWGGVWGDCVGMWSGWVHHCA